LSREDFIHFPSLALAFPISNFKLNHSLSVVAYNCPQLTHTAKLTACLPAIIIIIIIIDWYAVAANTDNTKINKITLISFVCLLRNWRRKYANDFANDLPR